MGASSLVLVLIVGFAALLLVGAIADVRARLIPDWVSLGIAGLYPIYVIAAGSPHWLGALGVALAVFVVGFALFALGLAGGGDVKLLAATALWAGPAMILPLLVVTGLAGGLVALVALAVVALLRGRKAALGYGIPYGVAIAVGGLSVAHRLALS